MQHRLVVIGSLDENIELVKRAKKYGYYTIVCDGYIDGPAKKFADKVYDIDVRNFEDVVAMCLKEKVDGIVGSFSDLVFEQITKIASRANLKWYISEQQLRYYRDKNIQKNVLQELGISVPRHTVLIKNFADDELKNFDFPLVIKPVDGWGSKGIFVADCIEDIRTGFGLAFSKGTSEAIEVEEYIEAREYNMTAWVYNGKVYTISIADREKNPREDGSIPMLNRVAYPSKNTNIVYQKAQNVLQAFVDKTGQKSGPISMQFFYDKDTVTVCEIAGRIFGYEHELIAYCSGLCVEDLLLYYVYEESNVISVLQKHNIFFEKQYAGLYFVGRNGMRIANQQKVFEMGQHGNVVDFQVFYQDGEKIDNYGSRPYFARFYITAENRASLDEVTQDFFDTMTVLSTNGDEILYKFVLYQDK